MQKFAGRYYTLNCGLLEIFFTDIRLVCFLPNQLIYAWDSALMINGGFN